MPLCGNETRSAISCQKAKRVSHPCHFQTIPFPPEANGQLPRQDDLLASVHHTPLHESTIKQAEIENVRSAVSAARRRPSRAVRCPYARVSRLPWITGTRRMSTSRRGRGSCSYAIVLKEISSSSAGTKNQKVVTAQCGRKSIFHHDRARCWRCSY
jgi:hypothetical protein